VGWNIHGVSGRSVRRLTFEALFSSRVTRSLAGASSLFRKSADQSNIGPQQFDVTATDGGRAL